jgi:hypothetical protein
VLSSLFYPQSPSLKHHQFIVAVIPYQRQLRRFRSWLLFIVFALIVDTLLVEFEDIIKYHPPADLFADSRAAYLKFIGIAVMAAGPSIISRKSTVSRRTRN